MNWGWLGFVVMAWLVAIGSMVAIFLLRDGSTPRPPESTGKRLRRRRWVS